LLEAAVRGDGECSHVGNVYIRAESPIT
jgi:hypothetical protein